MSEKHTPGTWEYHQRSDIPWALAEAQKAADYLIAAGKHHVAEVFQFRERGYEDLATATANARRICECVNALEGIPDPAAFLAAVRELREAADTLTPLTGGNVRQRAVRAALNSPALAALGENDAE